ncbi:hypothetical protein J8M14_00005, partial [Aquimarina sp. MMG016]|nr:hypothetical protein [Aquimarina sp. MMG016]
MKINTQFLMRPILFFLAISLYTLQGNAQTDLWWTGANNNNWSEGPNWSTTDPALGPATPAVSAPSGAVDVHFNNGSFPNAAAYTILVDSDVNCKSLLFEGDGNATSIILNGGGELSVFGDLIFLPEAPGSVLNVILTNRIVMTGTSTGNLVDFQNQSIGADLEFDGIGASWIFQSPAQILDDIILTNGTLDFNSQSITLNAFLSNEGNLGKNILFDNAILNFRTGNGVGIIGEFATLSGNPEFLFDLPTTGGNGSIRMGTTGATPTLSIKKIRSENVISLWLDEENDAFFEDIETGGINVRNSAPVDIGNLSLKYGSLSQRTGIGGAATARVDNLTITGDGCLTHSFSLVNLDFDTRPTLERLSLSNSDAFIAGVAAAPPITVTGSFDNGGNDNWDIVGPITKNYYWIGNSGDWNTLTNWSNTSGGTPLDPLSDCLPSQADDVFFDANSFNADGQAMNIDAAAICRNMTWQGLDQIAIDWTGVASLDLWGDLTLDKNMVEDISYDQILNLRDAVEGLFDFQSGADNRNMPNVFLFWPDNNVTYRQLSDEVYVGYIRSMGRNNSRVYDIGGNQNSFRTRLGIRDAGTINMENANLYNEGSSTAITGSGINIISDADSHYYSTNPGTIIHFRGSSLFPDFTQTEPTATIEFFQSNFVSTGDAVFNGSFDGATSNNGATVTTVAGKLTLSAGNTHQFLGNITANEIEAKGTSCGDGPIIRSKTGAQIDLDVPQGNADFQFATISDLNYVGDTNPLDLDGQEATDAGNTNNIDLGGIVSNVYYWRPNPDDNSYSGNWNNPKYWALNKADTNGQATAAGCVPKAQDSVVFDNQSGNGSLVNVLLDDSQAVKSITWVNTGADAIPANMNFEVASTGVLDIKANLNLADAMTTAWGGATNFNGADTTRIDTRGKDVGGLVTFQNGVSILQSDWNGDANIQLDNGELNTNENDLTINSFFSRTTDARKLIIKNSTINITGVELTVAGNNGSPRTSWIIQNAQTSPLEFDGENSIINITALIGENNFYGDGLTYNSVNINPSDGSTARVINFYGENTFLENLDVVGTGNFFDSFTVNKFNLSTDVNHEFIAGNTTTFLEEGNLEKNGDLSKFLNLNSSINGSLHNFVKATGGNIFICNLNIVDVQATGVPFKTNDVSTYNGLAGAAAAPPTPTAWDFTAASTPATIDLTDPADIHINLGDDALINYSITGNDTGPYRATLDVVGISTEFEILSVGDPTTGVFDLEPSATDDIEVINFEYFDCPGSFNVGSGIGEITPIKIPSVTGKTLAADGATETYPFNNKQGFIYVMDGADRTDLVNFETRLPQVAIQDGLSDTDTDILGDVTVTTTIDPTNIDNSPFVYLTRRWEITNTGANSGANVRFYLTQAELVALKTAANKPSVPDLEFLESLSLFKLANGATPGAGVDQTQQPRLNARVATEISATTYVYEAFIDGISGSYALGTSISPGGVASSIKLWIKASKDVTDTAGEVTNWADQSGAGVDFVNTGLATGITSGPTYNTTTNLWNYNPTVSFDGTQGLYEATKSVLDPNNLYTIWLVVQGTPAGVVWSQEADLTLPTAGTNPSITVDGQTDQVNSAAAGGADNALTGGLDVTEPTLIVASRNDSGSFNWTLINYRNGTQANTATFTGELETVLSAMSLGYRHKTDNTSESPFIGSLAEMIVYGQVLSEADNIKVATYLAQKHGITLSHDYVASDDVTLFDTDGIDATYANDIAGIGRDDQSCQDQRQSKSNNTDAIIAMGLSAIETTNAANTTAFTNDQEHLYWGNDNGAVTWTATGAPENYQVLTRTWKVKEAGAVGAVKVQFDVADGDFDVPNLISGTAYFIVVDTNDDGELSDETPTALTNVSGDLWEVDVDFANNALFSIATSFIDTDGDNIPDVTDVDDDNDGILDTEEDNCDINRTIVTTTIASGSGDPQVYTATDGSTVTLENLTDNLVTNDVGLGYRFGTSNGTIDRDYRMTFSAPVNAIILDLSFVNNNVDGEEALRNFAINGGGNLSITHTDTSTGVSTNFNSGVFSADLGGADASTSGLLKFVSNLPFTELTFTFDFIDTNGGGGANNPFGIMLGEICILKDTDGDQITDSLDLDSDNDGIPDNVEAQTTTDYIAPTVTTPAQYITNSGVNNAYLTTNGGNPGLDPVDTDNNATEDLPDYLDTDTDDDTVLDIAENGDPDNAIVTFTDDDGDGIDNLFDTVDNTTNWDVNDKVTTGDIANLQSSFGDFDSDAAPTPVPLDSDLSFRDNCQINVGVIAGDQNVCAIDDPVAFTVNTVTSVDSGTVTYQWQSSTTSATATDFANITGATSATYDSPTVTQDTWFKRIDTNTLNGVSCSLETNVVAITVQIPPEAGTTTDFAICAGDTVTLAQLNASLSGADTGGTWTPTLAGAGVYTYTV